MRAGFACTLIGIGINVYQYVDRSEGRAEGRARALFACLEGHHVLSSSDFEGPKLENYKKSARIFTWRSKARADRSVTVYDEIYPQGFHRLPRAFSVVDEANSRQTYTPINLPPDCT